MDVFFEIWLLSFVCVLVVDISSVRVFDDIVSGDSSLDVGEWNVWEDDLKLEWWSGVEVLSMEYLDISTIEEVSVFSLLLGDSDNLDILLVKLSWLRLTVFGSERGDSDE